MDTRTGLPIVGMVGGGLLARMTHQAAIALGQSLRVFVASAGDAAALVTPDVHIGAYTDVAALRRFAEGCEVVTLDSRYVPMEVIDALEADGVTVAPSAAVLRLVGDEYAMRERLAGLDVPMRWPEQGVPVGRQLVAIVARSPFGQVAAYPVAQVEPGVGTSAEVVAPAPGLPDGTAIEATELAIRTVAGLDLVGVLAVVLVEMGTSLAVHRPIVLPVGCGLWTVDGARTSQFEQHLRAVLDYPLGDTGLAAPMVVTVTVCAGADGGMSLDERVHHLMAAEPGVKLHLYGVPPRPGQRIGHLTALGDDLADVRLRATRAANWLAHAAR